MENQPTDLAWQNSKTGNTLAVLTECSETIDPSLKSLEGEMVQALDTPNTLKSENSVFEDRESLRSLVAGKVDGVPVKMDILTFKKNSCSYILTYMGKSEKFDQDHQIFENFLKGFKVP
jgi:hypothetical protein